MPGRPAKLEQIGNYSRLNYDYSRALRRPYGQSESSLHRVHGPLSGTGNETAFPKLVIKIIPAVTRTEP
jgi:hypothetical protein